MVSPSICLYDIVTIVWRTDNCAYNVPLFRVQRVIWYAVGSRFVVMVGDVSDRNSSDLLVSSLPPLESRLLDSRFHLEKREEEEGYQIRLIHLNPDFFFYGAKQDLAMVESSV